MEFQEYPKIVDGLTGRITVHSRAEEAKIMGQLIESKGEITDHPKSSEGALKDKQAITGKVEDKELPLKKKKKVIEE